jgi:hypothetical protein
MLHRSFMRHSRALLQNNWPISPRRNGVLLALDTLQLQAATRPFIAFRQYTEGVEIKASNRSDPEIGSSNSSQAVNNIKDASNQFSEEERLKKEIEGKNKEIIDLKVREITAHFIV